MTTGIETPLAKGEGDEHLVDLGLSNAAITDAGLVHLKGLTDLKYLGLQDTDLSAESVEDFQESLPDCKIVFP